MRSSQERGKKLVWCSPPTSSSKAATAGISADSSAAVMSLMVGLWRAQCAEVTHEEGENERHKHSCQNSVINKTGPIHKEISGK